MTKEDYENAFKFEYLTYNNKRKRIYLIFLI